MKIIALKYLLEFLFFVDVMAVAMGNIWTMLQSTHIQSRRLSTHPRNVHNIANSKKIDSDAVCKSHKDCPSHQFCDKHYNLCDKYRAIGEPCREDYHCQNKNICMYGLCEKPPKEASKGARCNSDSDCDVNMCCIRRHGEKICQPKLKFGQKCYVPKGGLDYSLNQQCPCADGLICRHLNKNKPQMHKSGWRYNNFLENLRCTT